MPLFFISTNTALTIIVALGIHSFSESWLLSIIGALVITGSASANPIFALLAYPAIEYFFNKAGLTIYSALTVGITLSQLAFVYLAVKNSTET
jgi:hypothetical protein